MSKSSALDAWKPTVVANSRAFGFEESLTGSPLCG